MGEVYAITEPLERLLDGIESEYPAQANEYAKRELTIVMDEQSLACIVYEIKTTYIKDKPQIMSGDWIQNREL